MTKKDFAIIAVRIVALYSLIQAVPYIGHVIYFGLPGLIDLVRGHGASNLKFGLVSPGVTAFAALIPVWAILWFKADAIAGRIVRGCAATPESATVSTGNFDRQGAMIVGSALLGLYLLVGSITRAASEIGWFLYRRPRQDSLVYPQRSAVYLVAYLVQMAISLWLMLGSRGLVAFISRFRAAGIKPEQGQAQ